MFGRVGLWGGFLIVHIVVAISGYMLPNQPMGDVYLVYEPWARAAIGGEGVVGIDSVWVYPQLALLPMLLAAPLAGILGYPFAWAVVVTVFDAVAFTFLVGGGRARSRRWAAGFWLAAILLIGPVGMYRLDAATVPLAILGVLWAVRRPMVAGVLLAAATWMKVWPAALIAAAVVAMRGRVRIIVGGLIVSVAIVGGVLLAGGTHLFGFLTMQQERGLQVEAPASAPFLWATVLQLPGYSVGYNYDILTFQVTGPAVSELAAGLNTSLVLAVLLIAVAGVFAVRRGASPVALLPSLATSLVCALMVFNKVGSPQFQVWLIAPILLGIVLDRRRWLAPAVLALVSFALTFLVYPMLYGGIIVPESLAVTVLTLRNLAVVALFVWMLSRVFRAAMRVPSSRTAPV